MTKNWDVVTVAAAVGSGVLGGVFFAFSTFVMSGLMRMPGSRGLETMKSINVTAQQPPLMIALFGTAALCVALIVHAVRTWGDTRATLLVAGAVLYLVGVVVMTATYHVPINDKVAALPLDSLAQWHDYARRWTLGNHVRTVLSIGAAVLFVLAARQPSPSGTTDRAAAGRAAVTTGLSR